MLTHVAEQSFVIHLLISLSLVSIGWLLYTISFYCLAAMTLVINSSNPCDKVLPEMLFYHSWKWGHYVENGDAKGTEIRLRERKEQRKVTTTEGSTGHCIALTLWVLVETRDVHAGVTAHGLGADAAPNLLGVRVNALPLLVPMPEPGDVVSVDFSKHKGAIVGQVHITLPDGGDGGRATPKHAWEGETIVKGHIEET